MDDIKDNLKMPRPEDCYVFASVLDGGKKQAVSAVFEFNNMPNLSTVVFDAPPTPEKLADALAKLSEKIIKAVAVTHTVTQETP